VCLAEIVDSLESIADALERSQRGQFGEL